MPLVTHAEPRSQSSYGTFAPRADTRQYGVVFAAIGDGGDGRFPNIDAVQNVGLQVGNTNQYLRYEEYKGNDGKPHDITLPNGSKVREMIAPIKDIQEKEKIEGELSEKMISDYSKDRRSEDGRIHLAGQITENTRGRFNMQHDPALREQLQQASPSAPRPRGNAAALPNAREAKATKRASEQPATA